MLCSTVQWSNLVLLDFRNVIDPMDLILIQKKTSFCRGLWRSMTFIHHSTAASFKTEAYMKKSLGPFAYNRFGHYVKLATQPGSLTGGLVKNCPTCDRGVSVLCILAISPNVLKSWNRPWVDVWRQLPRSSSSASALKLSIVFLDRSLTPREADWINEVQWLSQSKH